MERLEQADGDLARRIAAIATPLTTDDDLDPVIRAIGAHRIVLLGEATHGTHEFYAMRARLTRRLIEERGFVGVAVEGDWPDSQRVDRWVRGASTDRGPIEALGSFRRFPAWMWRNTDVVDLLAALHADNARRPAPERVGFYGLDLYSLHASVQAVLEALATLDPDAVALARERYDCFDHTGGDPQAYGLAALHLGSTCEDRVVRQLVELHQRRLRAAAADRDAWFRAEQDARVVRNAEAYYRAMFGSRIESWNLRDTHMADTFDELAAHLGAPGEPAKLVVWAHNSHVGDARATELGDGGELTLGQLLRQRHPGEVAIVGFTTHAGTVTAAYDWDEPPRRETVRPALPGSWEAVFHATGVPRFLLPMRALGGRSGPLGERRLERAIGVVYRPRTERASHYFTAQIGAQFDLVIHVDQTRAVIPLDPMRPVPSAPDAPETFPSGM